MVGSLCIGQQHHHHHTDDDDQDLSHHTFIQWTDRGRLRTVS